MRKKKTYMCCQNYAVVQSLYSDTLNIHYIWKKKLKAKLQL